MTLIIEFSEEEKNKMKGFIKLHRQLLNWEWYPDINVRVLFIHCLLKANHCDQKWRGILIPKGSFVTSYGNLSAETNLSIRAIRTALNKLKSTSELTHKGQGQYSIITIKNWDKFQENDKQNDKRATSERQASDKRATTNKNDKNDKNEKNEKKEYISADPFFNPLKDFFLEKYFQKTGKKPRLSLQDCQRLIELEQENPDLKELIPIAIDRLVNIDFGDIPYSPGVNWLLKGNNFERVINGEFEKKKTLNPGEQALLQFRAKKEQK